MKKPGCRLCEIELDPEQTLTLENEHCLFIQRPQVVLVGSGLIIPRQHRKTTFDLTPDEWAATYDLLQQAKALLDTAHHPEGYNLGWNVGYIGGQDISHAHLHVIPRFTDEPHAGKGIRYWLKQQDNKRPG